MEEFISGNRHDYNYKLTDKELNCLLSYDDQYGALFDRYLSLIGNKILNIDDEYNKFISDNEYEPDFILEDKSAEIYALVDDLNSLKSKIEKMDVFISRFYIENIKFMIRELRGTYSKYDKITLDVYEWALSKISPYLNLDPSICKTKFYRKEPSSDINLLGKGFFHHQLLDEAYYMMEGNHILESAFMVIVSFNGDRLSFPSLYEWIKTKVPYWDTKDVFEIAAMVKTSKFTNEMASSFVNIIKIHQLPQYDRSLLKTWRVGVEHLNDIPDLKTFFYINKMEKGAI